MEESTKEIKCVVWDLDNTLWDGILLEDKEVILKPGICEIIKELDSRGVLNSVASRNNYEDAMKKLEEAGIREYFLYPEITWDAKSKSIDRIIKNLNIGQDTILFIDDQQFELDEVKHELPQVTCINSCEYMNLLEYPRLRQRFNTEDSKRRRLMYLEDIERKKDEDSYNGPTEKFLMSLDMRVTITEAEESDLQRAEELTVRTNQLNATGVTYSYSELNEYRKSDNYKLFICELTDKYGSYGKIGLALVEIKEYWHLKMLLMSCRVMSRGIGTVLLSFIMGQAKKNGGKLYADFKMTDRNRQMYITYKFANFKEVHGEDADGVILMENELSIIQEYPPFVEVSIM